MGIAVNGCAHPLRERPELRDAAISRGRLPLNAPLHRDPVSALLGQSAHMENLCRKIMRLTSASAHVVINGESGTGKSLIARILHAVSGKDARRFEVVDCRILAESRIIFGQGRNLEISD